MKALKFLIAGGVAATALMSAAPAAAQYYPGYGGGNVIGQVLNQVLGGGYGAYGNPYGGYGGYNQYNQQAIVSQCANAVQQRLNGGNGYGGYGAYGGGYAPYGYNNGYNGYGYGNARVLGISRVEPRSSGGLTVRGVANSGMSAGYGYGYAGQGQVDLTWKCKTDYRGFISDIDIDRVNRSNSYGYTPYDYSQYGYRRY
jgi:hypothetical protein